MVAFGELSFQSRVTNQLFGWKYCVVQSGTFYPRQDYKQVKFYKISHLYSIGWSVRDGKVTTYFQLVKIGFFQQKFDKNYFFVNIPSHFKLLCEEKLEVPSLLKL